MTESIEYCKVIKEVAEENGFEVEGSEKKFTLDNYKWHSVAYLIQINSSGYIQVHQWKEPKKDDDIEYGRAVYSLRNLSDVVKFCNILTLSSEINARR